MPRGRKVVDRTGQRYGKLTAIKMTEIGWWLCQCDCGNTTLVRSSHLGSGQTKSCGCLRAESMTERMTKHGKSRTRLHGVWRGMRSRCNDPNSKGYRDYGGRGIKVCEEWDDFEQFHDWAMANGYDPDAPRGQCTIERIDVNGNYCPENCCWIPVVEQSRNRRPIRRDSIVCKPVELLDDDGNVVERFESIVDAARATGCNNHTISRVCNGEQRKTGGKRWRWASKEAA